MTRNRVESPAGRISASRCTTHEATLKEAGNGNGHTLGAVEMKVLDLLLTL